MCGNHVSADGRLPHVPPFVIRDGNFEFGVIDDVSKRRACGRLGKMWQKSIILGFDRSSPPRSIRQRTSPFASLGIGEGSLILWHKLYLFSIAIAFLTGILPRSVYIPWKKH
jgi:hypothetical protein